ncbi:MAG TPA: hypothetical protein VKV26_11110 [Dehalococcoidia bacterium]|nr:hypothetical protein [Dehalococcoidia bacterium]
MMSARKPEAELIAEALQTGQLSVPDEHGFHHELYAACPTDDSHVAPARTIWKRDASGRHIDQLEFHCPRCGHTWQAARAELHLR